MDGYHIEDTSEIISPALVVFREPLLANIKKMIEIAGDVSRLRPHCKTHKMCEVTQLQIEHGIKKHKCATFAEAEMLVDAGAKDIFLAYNLVGPNIRRAVKFREKYPDIKFAVTADHPLQVSQLGEAMSAANQEIEVLLDLDTGQHRTGLEAGSRAKELYQQIADTGGLKPGGLHVYDGQNHQASRDERQAAVDECWNAATGLRDELVKCGLDVPRIVAGGTGSFPCYAEKDDPALELSPGTCVFHDVGYRDAFPDLTFQPAAMLLTRVVSRPGTNRVTVDLGYKAVAADQPADRRVEIPSLPDARQVLQNEEHLVLETSRADEFQPGDELLAIPRHICPTSALHKQVWVVEDGKVTEQWNIASRDRWLTI